MQDETLEPAAYESADDLDSPIPVMPFIEARAVGGNRTWIRKSMITGIEEVSASEWQSDGERWSKPSVLVHALGGKTWRISAEAEEFIRELGQAGL